jgi:hypothetical protein
MRKYITGFILGLAVGTVVPAAAASLVGGTGYLSGWTVTKNGEDICDAPFVWTATREIECD